MLLSVEAGLNLPGAAGPDGGRSPAGPDGRAGQGPVLLGGRQEPAADRG
jgi:hypothetical protein